MNQNKRLVAADRYTDFGERILVAQGVPQPDARLLSDSLVKAELWGHSSHGMLRLPWYVARLRSGAMKPVTRPETVTDSGSMLVVDGNDGIGQVLTAYAVDEGIRRAREHTISGVAVRNSNHFGTAAYFTRRAAEQGCVALLATNASPAMAPWGGREKGVGTNPWSIAAPGGRHGVVVMDIANTAVARGKIYLAKERGEAIPEGWAADSEGRPTTDPAQAVEGLILPLGGHKGYVISFMFDVLAGVLTGSAFGRSVVGPYSPEGRSGCGHLLITIDVAAMTSEQDYAERIEALVAETKATPLAADATDIFYPGELEDRNERERLTDGIPVAAQTWESMRELSKEASVPLPSLL